MRRPALLKAKRGTSVSNSQSIPAPTRGWNSRDAVSDMNEADAITMINWWPTASDIQVRKGQSDHATSITGQVETLMPYIAEDGTETLFAAAVDSFYNVTSAGAVGAAVVGSLTNARWQYVNNTTSSASYLCAFNGTDSPRYWDGSSWLTITGASSPAITGVTTSALNCPWIHKRRMWMVQEDTLTAWYLPVDAVGGAAAAINLYGICQHGGHLVAGATWTLDAGTGVDDHWVAVTSEGEVVVYAGTDPASSTTWALVGVWKVGEPIGRRCLYKYRGDLLIICRDGVYPMSKLLVSGSTDASVAITDRIRGAMQTAGASYNANFGWQTLFYPEASMLILNVPTEEGDNQHQYAMNTITGAWCKFTGMDANCWAIFQGQPYFGGNTKVTKFWTTYADNGANISTELKQAFNYFGTRGRQKWFKSMRPILLSDGTPEVLIDINVDYRDEYPGGSLTFAAPTYGVWDSATWDSDTWGGALNISDEWLTIHGVGICAANKLISASNGIELRMQATDILYEHGNIIS